MLIAATNEPAGTASRWDGSDASDSLHAERSARAVAWLDAALPAHAHVLDAGCGAGVLARDIAGRGHRVAAVDARADTLALAAAQLAGGALPGEVTLSVADVAALPFGEAAFDGALAVGLLPYVERPDEALAELARVLRPGGSLVATTMNPGKLTALADPVTRRRRARASALHTRAQTEALLAAAGFRVERLVAFGFAPVTLLGSRVLPEGAGVRLHRRLQALADADRPLVRGRGGQWLALAKRR
jgi:ubiquinone/menaquinone biosynthesis C-methylase UbiE